ncbi:MAG: ABC transporter ATP-binding protein [Acidobacteriota bacterium]
MNGDAFVAIDGLRVDYPGSDRPAVDDLSLQLPAGQVFGLLGPNGAGKTTTLRVLAGLLQPDAGEVRIGEARIDKHPDDARRLVGYLPDHFGLYEDLTCREYLEFFAAALGIPRDQRRRSVEDALALTDLEEKADALAGALSRGMQQRLALARVLVHEPDLLLLDEPASGLDPRARIEIREVLQELGRMGKTVVVSSHVLADIAQICNGLAILDHGKVVTSGSLQEVLRQAGRDELTFTCGVLDERGRAADVLAADATFGDAVVEPLSDDRLQVRVSRTALGFSDDVENVGAATLRRTLTSEGLTVTHLVTETADLEDAFLQLTGDDEDAA